MHRIFRIICADTRKQGRLDIVFITIYNLIRKKDNLSIDEDISQLYKSMQIPG